jgi:thiamine biosynthesis protein ThiS
MNIIINGEQRAVATDISIAQILETYKIIPTTIVVELNESIIQSDTYASRCLAEGDRLEFIHFVGGG